MEPDGMVDELAELAGIESDFWTFSGEHCIVSRASKAAILKAMGFPAGNPGDIRESLRRFQGQFHGGMIGPVHVYRGPRTHYTVPVNIPARRFSHPLKWRLFADDGACWSGEVKAEGLADSADMHAVLDDWERRNLPIPRVLPWGYHRLSVEVGDCPPAETTMIVAPEKAFLPDWLSDGEKRWGLACFLPGLQSETNWGIGDFTDLGEMVAEAGRIGASYVGLNPLHALFPGLPEEASPYSPSSRLFLNAWQIDVTRMDGFSDCQALHDFLGRGETKTWLRDVRQTDLIDYQAVAEGKLEAFQILFQHFQARHSEGSDDPLRLEFRYFIERGGRHLRLFAAFESLHRRFGVRDWRQWPPEFRDPRSAAVTEYCGDHPNELAFHMFLQWQADRQLSMVAKNQEKWNGRPVGLYGDLAVGCHLCGADSWIEGDFFAGGICFGAPPDPFNADGQNWGMAPMNPHRLWRQAYAPFIGLMQANMRHVGALRIDHVMSLRRLFWIPDGAENRSGAYVKYPLEDLLAIIALESHRNECLVIGEDLGTVPDGFREKLAAENILSYRVLPFERHESKLLHRPELYPAGALVTTGTHDLPSILGHWRGTDIELRRELANTEDQTVWQAEEATRAEDRELIRAALVDQGLIATDFPLEPELDTDTAEALILALERFAARSPAALMMINLDDMLKHTGLLNLPGTILEYPNWRKKAGVPTRGLSRNTLVRALIDAIRAEGRG